MSLGSLGVLHCGIGNRYTPERLYPIVVDMFGASNPEFTELTSCAIWVSYDDGATYETAVLGGYYDGDIATPVFDERYADGSTLTEDLDEFGYTWSLKRRGGMPGTPTVVSYFAPVAIPVGAGGSVSVSDLGPVLTATPADLSTLTRDQTLQLRIVGGDYALVEESINIWISFDGRRWEPVVMEGEFAPGLHFADGIKTPTAGGFDFYFSRPGGWYRKTLYIYADAADVENLSLDEEYGTALPPPGPGPDI